ncbi:MAG: DUF5011 domain-containing protein, partial [Acholeplasmataceae bacterium]|nr:DUF5011 domain-containing protein [Acholeplasmataceae bacterium]
MKKRIPLLLLMLLGLVLTACGTKTVKPPELSGIEPVEIMVGDDFDPLDGVAATDEKDGNITSKIVVEGTVDVNKAGVYELVYKVKNAGGKEAKKTRFVTVKALGGLVNGDFSEGLEGWDYWVNDTQDVDAEVTVVNKEAVVNIIAQAAGEGGLDNNWWDVQLKQTKISFEKFESLKLVFTARAENPRKMMVNLQGGGLEPKAINDYMVSLTTEDQTFEIEFFGKTAAVDAELQFALGTFYKVEDVPEDQKTVLGKVYISNVKIVAGPELENQAPTLTAVDVLLKVGAENFLTKQGVVVDDDRDVLTLDDVVATDITDGKKFKLPAEKGIYTFKFSVTDSGGLTTEVTRKVVVADAFDIPPLDNVDENGIPVGWIVWHEETRGGLEVSAEDGVVEIEITKVGDSDDLGDIWENQFKVMDLAPFKGVYTLSFYARANDPRPMVVAIEGDGGIGLENEKHVVNLTSNWELYTIDVEVDSDGKLANRNLQFWFGNMAKEEGYTAADNVLTKVYLSDIKIGQEEIEVDLGGIVNGKFSNGLFGWFTWYNDSQDVDVEYSVVDGVAVINIKEQSILMDNNWWDVQIGQRSITFEDGQALKLVFT